ncbi:MAG: hypothetical protein WA872_16465 [Candidatus Sulfotelmatobacter sp.]
MTLITVFPYPDGHIISADSQETVTDEHGDQYKYGVLKLKPEKMGKFQVVIAGGGNGEAIDAFIEVCRQFFATSRIKTLAGFKKEVQEQLYKFRRKSKSVGDDSTMHLFIAAQIDKTYAVWMTKAYTLSEVKEPDMIGFTDQMYRHTVKEFQPKNLPATQLILLSLRVLDFARQTSTCVDKPYSVVIINKDGIHVFDEEVIKQFVQSMDTFGAAVNRLLLSCGDTSIRSEVFKQKVEEFSETTQHLRKDYMETVGERTFKRMFESGYCGDPISIIPPGTKLTVDSEYNVDVSEMSSEEREHHFSMKKEAEHLAEELRVAQEKMAKLVQGREPLHQGRERVLLRPARPHSVKAGTQAS